MNNNSVDRDFTWLDMEITDLDKVVWKGHHISYEDVFTELRNNDYYEIETILDKDKKWCPYWKPFMEDFFGIQSRRNDRLLQLEDFPQIIMLFQDRVKNGIKSETDGVSLLALLFYQYSTELSIIWNRIERKEENRDEFYKGYEKKFYDKKNTDEWKQLKKMWDNMTMEEIQKPWAKILTHITRQDLIKELENE